jgi:hypothetical protein
MLEFAASLLPFTEALATPKRLCGVTQRAPRDKRMTSKDLVRERKVDGAKRREIDTKSEVQNNAYSVHAPTKHSEMAVTRAIPVLCSTNGEGAWGADVRREKGQALGQAEDLEALNLAFLLRGYTKSCRCTGKVPRPRGTKAGPHAQTLCLAARRSGTTPLPKEMAATFVLAPA